MSTSAGPSIVKSGLAFEIDAANPKSYPGTGTTVYDVTKNLGNSTMAASATYSTANTPGWVFNNSSTSYITLPTNAINSNADFTLNFWNTITANPATTTMTLLGSSVSSGYLQVRYSAGVIDIVRSFQVDLGSFSGFTASQNSTYYITVSRSVTTLYLYVNGVYISQKGVSGTFTTTTPALGTNYINYASENMIGTIYNFSYYTRALTADEVTQNYNALRGRYGL